MLLLLPSHAGLEEEVSGSAHPAPGDSGVLEVPGKEAKSVTNPDPPAWGWCNALNLFFFFFHLCCTAGECLEGAVVEGALCIPLEHPG